MHGEVPQIRLNRALATAGICSRRKADDLIRAGAVAVNGTVVLEPGLRVNPLSDTLSVYGRAVGLRADEKADQYCLLMLNKPVQVLSTVRDPQGRPCVLDYLPREFRQKRLYPVGRLDFFSEGLILLTDDGYLTHALTHPSRHIPRIYRLTVRESPTPDVLARMRSGMTLSEGDTLLPAEAELVGEHVVSLVLRQGVNRQIRRMCRDLGLTVLRLERTGLGPLKLGDLPKGRCRPLSREEVVALHKAAGTAR
ncbi:MAG: rRNA pseudouridine synthase [Desulfovibrio sp.]|jgi:23S rRNA pseudouridine2605 synthase|nr:rRNA pseudouridine synthase [Desulfovibrio sp.]